MPDKLQVPIEPCRKLFNGVERDNVGRFAQRYPEESHLEIPFSSVYEASMDIADDLRENPEVILERFHDGLAEVDLPVIPGDEFAEATIGVSEVRPDIRVSDLREDHVGKYIGVYGRVNEVSKVTPKLKRAGYECLECGETTWTEPIDGSIYAPKECDLCGGGTLFELSETDYEGANHQYLELGSLPEENQTGNGSDIAVEVENDLVNEVSPGDIIRANGILRWETGTVTPQTEGDERQDTYLECYAIDAEEQTFDEFETERVDEIEAIAERNDLFDALIDSFAPHILTDEYGDMQKLGMILQQFGGVRRELPNGTEKRPDINILLVGDPGTAKSQYLQSAANLAPKATKASGKGATAAGLTATAEQSDLTGSWTLKAGALVLANNGLACIDEFDKMADAARKSMHEALEDQEIPINKAGINTTLPAKCGVLAAANPEGGRYDRVVSMAEQVNLDPPLIQRFDLIFGLKDEPDESRDRDIVAHQLAFDTDAHDPDIETDLLREYVAYARQRVTPSWDGATADIKDMVADYYLGVRSDSKGESGAIGPRLTDGIRRLAEASARARLSETVEAEDVERATSLASYHIGQVALDSDGDLSADQFDGTTSKADRRAMAERIDAIQTAFGGQSVVVSDIVDEVREDRSRVEADLKRMVRNGQAEKESRGRYKIKEVVDE